MTVSQVLDKLGLLRYPYYRLTGHGDDGNHGLELTYLLPEGRMATVRLRVDLTRNLTNAVPRNPWQDELWESYGNCPIKNFDFRMEPEEQPR